MSDSKKPETRKRSVQVKFRLSEEEKAAFDAACDDTGLTSGEYCRLQCLHIKPQKRRRRKPTLDQQLLSQLLRQMGHVGCNVNQIAHKLNAGGSVMPEEVKQTMIDIRQLVNQAQKALDC